MTELIEIELTKAPKPIDEPIEPMIEVQQDKKIRWMNPVVLLVAIGVVFLIVVLGLSTWIGITGLENNLSEREGGLAVPGTNLGSQDGPNLGATGGVLVPDISSEPPHEKDPNGKNRPRRDTADTEETGPVDPKTLTSVLLKWMNIRYPPRTDGFYTEFQWQNKSAAQPAVVITNWLMVTEVLASTVPMRSEEKRVWEYWAEWVLEIEEEKGWSTRYNYMDQKLIGKVESVKTRLHQLQNPEAAPETPIVEPPIDDSVDDTKPKPANPPTGGCGGAC